MFGALGLVVVEVSVALCLELDFLAFVFGVCSGLLCTVLVPCCSLDGGAEQLLSSGLPACLAFAGT